MVYLLPCESSYCVNVFQAYIEEHPDKTVSTTLVMAQLHLSQGGVYQACDRLKELGDLQYKPGVVCI